jgi:hypothetical protein
MTRAHARLEIMQLRGSDVEQIDGIWSVHLTPEAGTMKSGIDVLFEHTNRRH